MQNIILLITDTFRYDNLQNDEVRTPALAQFMAEKATSIDNFFASSFPTIPHRTDVATGRLGWPHYPWQAISQSSANHIAAILREQGYVSQLICDCPHLFNAGFQHGFDAAFQHRGQEWDKPLLHLNDPIPSIMPMEKTRREPHYKSHTIADMHRWINRDPLCEADLFPAKTADTTIRWLEENYQHDGFFLWVDFFDPHEPWDAPEYLVKRIDPDYTGTPMLHPNYGPVSEYTPAELKNLRAHYLAESELVARHLGRILEKIDDLQLWKNSLVIITADHGISLGEHERTGKSNIHPTDARYWPIFPEIGHVPFLIAGPEIPAGQRLDFLAQPTDILPTICDLTDLPVTPPQAFHGKSFARELREGHSEFRTCALSGCHLKPETGIPAKAITPFLVTKKWGYTPVNPAGEPELFDLTTDPLAQTPVEKPDTKILNDLNQLFLQHLEQQQAPTALVDFWREKLNR